MWVVTHCLLAYCSFYWDNLVQTFQLVEHSSSPLFCAELLLLRVLKNAEVVAEASSLRLICAHFTCKKKKVKGYTSICPACWREFKGLHDNNDRNGKAGGGCNNAYVEKEVKAEEETAGPFNLFRPEEGKLFSGLPVCEQMIVISSSGSPLG